MSSILSAFDRSVVVRSAQAEVVGRPPTRVRLLADSSSTGTVLSAIRVTLENGADGAKPHHHSGSAELFYVLDGTVEVLSGTDIVNAEQGDLIVVPPGLSHAFGASRGRSADLLIVITPGVERFGYFRKLERIAYGHEPPESLREVQELYDTYFESSPPWETARALSREGPR
jgi:mannose-6-phosphate isomerase-like protein (cupin superfamily)